MGPVDHAVPVLTVTRPDGKLEAMLFGYACHPTTLNFTKWCGDYPGFAQTRAGEEPSRRHGNVRQHVRRRSEPAAPPQRGIMPALRPHAGRRAWKRP